ncbi:hypothetical protein PCASD_01949 [Puccinia coronata f. sp. avenae]|uniref:Protein kinase domain-containing protein n=1 Tax=Puccinia coronata f. sp. avenae TaxID=200324 RepID=A0A2N5VHM9_9BASI|nr:hypothetical protein PCASD_01949 [Puccinia coronata f. sp. avenae]
MNQQSTRALTAYYSQKNNNNNKLNNNNNNNKTTSLREPPPLLLPKPSPELPIRRKKQQQTSQSPPHHNFKQTLHASLSQDGLELGQRRLNQYLLLRTIGKGSFGNVELAQDTSSFRIETTETQGKLFAIKEYSKSRMRKRARQLKHHHHPTRIKARTVDDDNSLHLSESELNSSEGIRLVRKEVAIMKKLAHPNIVSLLEVIDTDQDSLFFVLELCPYGPVMQIHANQAAESERLTESSARNVFRQIILGIEYLHFNQVIHRDIKPDNILYFENPKTHPFPRCKIVDFGVSESFAKPGDDRMHKSAGSPAFLAPEVCLGIGEGVHGRIIDIWAMGITLYALVCGRLPFEALSQMELCDKIIHDTPEFPAHLSESLLDLLRRLLNKAPRKRIQMEELRGASWVTEEGQKPMERQASDLAPVGAPTEREIAEAFSLRTIATMMKAIGKFRAKGRQQQQRRRRASQSQTGTEEEDGCTVLGFRPTVSVPVGAPAAARWAPHCPCTPTSWSTPRKAPCTSPPKLRESEPPKRTTPVLAPSPCAPAPPRNPPACLTTIRERPPNISPIAPSSSSSPHTNSLPPSLRPSTVSSSTSPRLASPPLLPSAPPPPHPRFPSLPPTSPHNISSSFPLSIYL